MFAADCLRLTVAPTTYARPFILLSQVWLIKIAQHLAEVLASAVPTALYGIYFALTTATY